MFYTAKPIAVKIKKTTKNLMSMEGRQGWKGCQLEILDIEYPWRPSIDIISLLFS